MLQHRRCLLRQKIIEWIPCTWHFSLVSVVGVGFSWFYNSNKILSQFNLFSVNFAAEV